jgi:hypothetical protein
MHTTTHYIGPQDGWVNVASASDLAYIRISSYPTTHPYYVFGDPSIIPDNTVSGMLVCGKAFEIAAFDAVNVDAFYVRVQNPVADSALGDGRLRIDVYADLRGASPPGTGPTSDSTLITVDSTLITADQT